MVPPVRGRLGDHIWRKTGRERNRPTENSINLFYISSPLGLVEKSLGSRTPLVVEQDCNHREADSTMFAIDSEP